MSSSIDSLVYSRILVRKINNGEQYVISHITRTMSIRGKRMVVRFAVHFDDIGVLNHLAAKAVVSPTGVAHDCDGAIQVAVLSMKALDDDTEV